MDYPNSLSLPVLESVSLEYEENSKLWDTIDDLIIGGSRINKKASKYLPKIPGERPEIYRNRLEKFTYHSILGEAIDELSRKFLTSDINITGLAENQNSVFTEYWKAFRHHGKKNLSNEMVIANQIFTDLISYGKSYVHLEMNGESTQNILTDIQNGYIPYITIHHPNTVTNSGDGWFKLRITDTINDRFSKPQNRVKWIFIDRQTIAVYSAIVEYSDTGTIAKILDGSEMIPVTDNTPIPLESIFEHGFSDIPLIEVSVSDKQWITHKAYLRQLEHLRELNNKHGINTMLYIQRTFKPRVEKEEDLEFVTETVDSTIESGNPYILDVEDFRFNEPNGNSSTTLLNSLNGIAAQIRSLYGLQGNIEETPGSLSRSGASKEMDFISVRDILDSFGGNIISALDYIYGVVSDTIGYQRLSISGLSNFQVNILSSDIDSAIRVQEVETQIAPTALQLFYARISKELVGSVSPEQETIIDTEIENIFKAPILMLESEKDKDSE